jgi:hypothetical protein
LRGHTLAYLVGGPVIAALACVVLLAWRSWVVVPPPLRPLAGLGTISYAVCLGDHPLTIWLRPSMRAWAGIAAALPIAAAAAGWRLVVRPTIRCGRSTASEHPLASAALSP